MMQKLKLNMMVLAMVLGVSAAFAFKPAHHKIKRDDTIYYARQTSPGHWSWQLTQPSGSCQLGSATCEISTSVPGTPPDDSFPSSYTVIDGNDKASVYSN